MANKTRLPVSTASPEQSVWSNVGQDRFREHLVNLMRASKEVPADPAVHSPIEWQINHSRNGMQDHLLPFEVEQCIADDLAFIAAAEEGHKEISAVGLEEIGDGDGLTVRIAANEGVSQRVRCLLTTVFDLLSECARRSNVTLAFAASKIHLTRPYSTCSSYVCQQPI